MVCPADIYPFADAWSRTGMPSPNHPLPYNAYEPYEDKKQRLITSFQDQLGNAIRLSKPTSNLFRERQPSNARSLDVSSFNRVIRVVPKEGYAEAEGMTTYEDLTRECLKYNVMPTVVPQLKSITIGGAVTGIGIESSSFRYGLGL